MTYAVLVYQWVILNLTQTGEDMNAPPPEDGLDGMEVAGPVGNDAAGMAGNVPGGAPGQI